MARNGWKVIDVDGHIIETAKDLDPYLDDRWKPRLTMIPSDSWDRHIRGSLTLRRDAGMKARVADMRSEGIDVSILYPTAGLNISVIRETEYVVALCRAYNDFIAEACKEGGGIIKAVGMLQLLDIDAAVEELNRCAVKLNLPGMMLPSDGYRKDLGEKELWPIYAEAERLGVGLGVHGGALGATGVDRFHSYIKVHTAALPIEIMLALTGIVLGGIPAKFPNLKIAFLEAGIGWVPYWVERMDEEFEMRAVEAPLLEEKPSAYCKGGNLFFSCEAEEEGLAYAIEKLGEDVILFASDYPHWDMTFPGMVDDIAQRTDISESAKRKLFEINPQRFYNLNLK